MGKRPLHDLQKTFFKQMTSGAAAPAATDGRFDIYQNAYRLRIREAITEDFSQSLAALDALDPLNTQFTTELFNDFFHVSFSETFTLSAVGFVWLKYLEATNIMLPKWFLELSHFEWELTLALYRDSDSEFQPRKVQLAPPSSSDHAPSTPQILLAPAVTLLEYNFPVDEMYTKKAGANLNTKTKIVCWRENDESQFSTLSDLSYEILEKILKGQNLAEITNELSATAAKSTEESAESNLAHKIQNAFAELGSLGIISVVAL